MRHTLRIETGFRGGYKCSYNKAGPITGRRT
jgi:hypothetical protein